MSLGSVTIGGGFSGSVDYELLSFSTSQIFSETMYFFIMSGGES